MAALLLGCAAVAAISGNAPAQFSSGVNVVEVYASVTDRQGQPVKGLQAAVHPGQVVEFDGNAVRHAETPEGAGVGTAGSAATRRRPRVTNDKMSSSTKPNSSTANDAATDVGPSLLPIATICTCSV